MEVLPGGNPVKLFSGRLGLQQRVIPAYRVPFFDLLATRCESGLSIFAGDSLPIEGINSSDGLVNARLFPAENLHFKDPSSSLYLCWQRGLMSWLKIWNPDVLVLEANPRYLSSFLALMWMHQHKRPVWGWGLGLPRAGNILERLFRYAFLKSMEGVIAYSQRGAVEYRAVGLKKVALAYNAAVHKPEQELPNRSVVFNGPPVVVFVGRLQTRKRVDLLIHACGELPAAIRPKLVIVGDGPALETLKKITIDVYPQTIFTGAVHGRDLAPILESSDLFVLPGTGGLAVQEAMAYGLPVIVAEGDGSQDDLVRTENGWIVSPGNQADLVTALQEALMDPPRLRLKGAESYRIIQEEINIETMVDMFVGAL